MKKFIMFFIMTNILFGMTCNILIKKFKAPNPRFKTMRQLKRWVNSHVSKQNPLKEQLLECLIQNAADNPNQETIAGE